MKDFLHHAALASPLFLLILAGWLLGSLYGLSGFAVPEIVDARECSARPRCRWRW